MSPTWIFLAWVWAERWRIVGILAMLALLVVMIATCGRSASAAPCITRPNLADRAGYWRYRIEPASGRRCWYQGARASIRYRVRASRAPRAVNAHFVAPIAKRPVEPVPEAVPDMPHRWLRTIGILLPGSTLSATERIERAFEMLLLFPPPD